MNYYEKYKTLPGGTRIYQVTQKGTVVVVGDGTIRELNKEDKEFKDKLFTFINPGNDAFYFIGTPHTNEKNPQNATFKLGITGPHHSFTPHAHGVQHFVKSEGFSGCLLYDNQNKKVIAVDLLPGSVIEIPPKAPHAFYNRSDIPLVTLIANRGLGIFDENYAITKELARKKLQNLKKNDNTQALENLASVLEEIEDHFHRTHPERKMTIQEKISAGISKIAQWLIE